MSFTAISWVWEPSNAIRDIPTPVVIEVCRQRNGGDKYAVRQAGGVMSKDGKWEYEPIPSSRDDAFMNRCRFGSLAEARQAVERHCKPRGRFAAGVTMSVAK